MEKSWPYCGFYKKSQFIYQCQFSFSQERKTLYSRYRRFRLTNRVFPPSKIRRQCRQVSLALVYLLNDRKRNVYTVHKNFLAVVHAVCLLRPYSKGTEFRVGTDHPELTCAFILAGVAGKLPRWLKWLMKYECDIGFNTRIRHQAADALSQFNNENGWFKHRTRY